MKPNAEGGYYPATPQEKRVYRKVDLITLPPQIPGTNCGNCKWWFNGYCKNPQIRQRVTERMCCVLWTRDEVKRPWEKE